MKKIILTKKQLNEVGLETNSSSQQDAASDLKMLSQMPNTEKLNKTTTIPGKDKSITVTGTTEDLFYGRLPAVAAQTNAGKMEVKSDEEVLEMRKITKRKLEEVRLRKLSESCTFVNKKDFDNYLMSI